MKEKKVETLAKAGLLCAMIALLTMFVQFPIPGIAGAYVNAGDVGVYVAAYLLAGPMAAAVAGIGSALADFALGSLIYAPATLVIKAVMALVAFAVFRRTSGWKQLFAPLAGGACMMLGYFCYEGILFGFDIALISVPFNLIQAAACTPLAYLMIRAAKRLK